MGLFIFYCDVEQDSVLTGLIANKQQRFNIGREGVQSIHEPHKLTSGAS